MRTIISLFVLLFSFSCFIISCSGHTGSSNSHPEVKKTAVTVDYHLPDSIWAHLDLVNDEVFSSEEKILTYRGSPASKEFAKILSRWTIFRDFSGTESQLKKYIEKDIEERDYSLVGKISVNNSISAIIVHIRYGIHKGTETNKVQQQSEYDYEYDDVYLVTVKAGIFIDSIMIASARSHKNEYTAGLPIIFERKDKNLFSATGEPYMSDTIDENGNSEELQFKELFYIGEDGKIKRK